MPSPPTSDPIFLDTNVVVYAMGHSPEATPATRSLESACRRVLLAIESGEITVVTSLVVLQELAYLLARWQRQGARTDLPTPRRVINDVVGFCHDAHVPALADLNTALSAYDARKHAFNDRLILATMRSKRLRFILTADRGFEGEDDITRLDPATFAAQLGQDRESGGGAAP